MHTGSKAFSLLEIIIAITIVALFITLPILAYSNYTKSSRDTKRKNDILKITQALEQYKAEKGSYPVNLDDLVTAGYLTEIPEDPKNGQDTDGEEGGVKYGYAYKSDGTTYELLAHLESDTDDGSGGSGGRGVFIVTPLNPAGSSAPIALLTQQAIDNPSPTIPSSTPYMSPTRLPSISVTPSPTNTPTNTPTPLLPDLRINSIVRSAPNYVIEYCNNGLGATSDVFTLEIKLNPRPANLVGTDWQRVWDLAVPAPSACATQTFPQCTWTELGTGCVDDATIQGTIDLGNYIDESNETNNTITQTFPVFTPTPSPTPRYCWATGGVCNPNCLNQGVTGITTHQVYNQCVAAAYQACWSHNGVNCADTSKGYDYAGTYEMYRTTANCTGSSPVTYFPRGSNDCSNNGSGTCYRLYGNGTFNGYRYTTDGTGSYQTMPGGACSNFTYLSGGSAPGWNGQFGQCTWGANAACPVATWTPGGAQTTRYKWTGGFCSPTGAGNCYLMNGGPASYPDSGGPAGCGTSQYWSSYTQCTWMAY